MTQVTSPPPAELFATASDVNDNYLGPHSRLLASRSLKSISDFYSASRSEVITLIVPRNPLCDTGPVPTTSACSLRACCAGPFDCFLCRAVPCVSGRLHWVIRPARDLIRCLKDLFHFKRYRRRDKE